MALWVVACVGAVVLLPAVTSHLSSANQQFLPASAPSSQAAVLAKPLLGTDGAAGPISVLVVAKTPMTTAQEQSIYALSHKLSKVTNVSNVRPGGMSKDGTAVVVNVSTGLAAENLPGLNKLLSNLRAVSSEHAVPGATIYFAGSTVTSLANQGEAEGQSKTTQDLSLLLIIVLLLIMFRAFLAPVLTLIPAMAALVVSQGLVGGLSAHGFPVSQITVLMLVVLILGAGTDYGLFLVYRIRENVWAGADIKEAVASSVAAVGESISASAGTVIVALLTLLLAEFGVYHDLAIPLAVGMVCMLVAGVTLLPALIAIFGKATFWPLSLRKPKRDLGMWKRVAGIVVKRPVVTLTIGVLFFGVLSLGIVSYKSVGFGGSTTAAAGSRAAIAQAQLDRHFPNQATSTAALVFAYSSPVWEHPGSITTATASLKHSGQFSTLVSPLTVSGVALSPERYSQLHALLGDPAKLGSQAPSGVGAAEYAAYRATASLVSANGKVVNIAAVQSSGSQESSKALLATPDVREAVSRAGAVSGAHGTGVIGLASALYDVGHISQGDLLRVIPIAILAIGLLLALVLRSLVAPIYLILSVGLSYLAALGLVSFIFIDVMGQSGLIFILPFLLFVFLLALGEDYNILVMSRIREEAATRPIRVAVEHAIEKTGPTITSAGIILAGTFAVLTASGGSGGAQVQAIGLGLAAGILMDTFLVRTLLVPAAVVLLGRWNWWPNKMSKVIIEDDASRDSAD